MMVDTRGGASPDAGRGSVAHSFTPEVSALIASKRIEVMEISAAHVPEAADIEAASYPEDEACSPENMAFRQAHAGTYFLEGRLKTSGDGGVSGEMVGFVCGTCSPGSELSHESMSLHDPKGPTLCIHSVVVAEKFRRKGYATTLLKAYLDHVALTQLSVRRVCLIAKEKLLHMYAGCGFALRGPSPVVHGKDQWYEMRKELDDTEPRMLTFVQVDSFTEDIFAGNPAAVFFTHRDGDATWMRKVAVEMNLSATCFLELQRDDEASAKAEGPLYALRWFTPTGEIELCGHGTLAAAHALWNDRGADSKLPIRFSTLGGVLTCQRDAEGFQEMDFPAEHVNVCLEAENGDRLMILEALGVPEESACFVGLARLDVLVEVKPEMLRSIKPDMAKVAAIDTRGVLLTCSGGGNASGGVVAPVADFESRYFAPRHGIDEDHVTGSAHCLLATYWSKHLKRNTMVGYQASPRGGMVRVTYIPSSGDDGEPVCDGQYEGNTANAGRVRLQGKAITVFRGLFRR